MREINTKSEFEEVIKGKVLVDFYADWCGPCKMLRPILERIEEKLDYEIVGLNVDLFRSIAMKYKVMSIPNLILFENGKVIKEEKGFKTEEELSGFLELN